VSSIGPSPLLVLDGVGADLDDQFFAEGAHWCRGIVGVYRCDPSAAEDLAPARELADRTHDDVNLGDICGWQGALALALGQELEGCRLLEKAVALADPFRPVTGARIRCILAEAAVRRGDIVDAGRWLDEALDPAEEARASHARPRSGWASLTPTERRVAELVVEGLTNEEIGARMFVSTATVKSHLNHTFDKLGLTTRRHLADAARANA